MVFSYTGSLGQLVLSALHANARSLQEPYLVILELENQLGLTAIHGLADELGCYPALSSIWLPRPGADIVRRCHWSTVRQSNLYYRLCAREDAPQNNVGWLGKSKSGVGRLSWNVDAPYYAYPLGAKQQ